LVFLYEAYTIKEKGKIILKLNPKLAPIKAAIFPIVKKPEFEKIAEDIFTKLKKKFNIIYDKSGSVGRRYARNDEIGTPFCITIDEKTLNDNTVTIRERDTTKQKRIKINELRYILDDLIDGEIKFEDL
jgi:glycyl-tRNA synthetase